MHFQVRAVPSATQRACVSLLLQFGAGQFFLVKKCSRQCRKSGIPGLHSPGATKPFVSVTSQSPPCPQTPRLESAALRENDWERVVGGLLQGLADRLALAFWHTRGF